MLSPYKMSSLNFEVGIKVGSLLLTMIGKWASRYIRGVRVKEFMFNFVLRGFFIPCVLRY